MSTDFEDRLRAARDSLPRPESTVSATTEQHVLAALPSPAGEARRLRMPRRRRLVGVAALVAAALVLGGFAGSELAGSTRAATSTPVPAFTPALGWSTVETTPPNSPKVPAPNKPDPVAWAANVPFDPQDLATAWPNPPLQNLPPDGIVISVVGPAEGPFNKQARIVKPPYRVEDMFFWASANAAAHAASTADNYQGQPAPNVSLYWISAPTGPDQGINISVWMGRNDPTPAMKAAADEELARLILPPPATTTVSTATTMPTTTTVS